MSEFIFPSSAKTARQNIFGLEAALNWGWNNNITN